MKLSVQLYSVRDQCAEDLTGTLKALKDMGLSYVELAGTYGLTAAEYRKVLDDLGLGVTASHVGLGELEADVQKVIDDNKTLGNDFVVIPWLGEDVYGAGWDKVGARFEPIGRKLAEAGLALGYHNHAFEFREAQPPYGFDVLFQSADPSLLKAQIDLFWVQFGGQDPAGYVRNYGSRVKQVHLKDGLARVEPTFAEPGTGIVDWDGVLAACREAGVEVGSIEYDVAPRHPLESVKASVEFFRARGIVE